jgi:hypothetical protein
MIIHYLAGSSSHSQFQAHIPSDEDANLRTSEEESSDPSDSPKQKIKMSERARYIFTHGSVFFGLPLHRNMDVGRGAGRLNPHCFQRQK